MLNSLPNQNLSHKLTSWEWRIQFVSAVLFCSLLLYFWPIMTNLKGKNKNRHTKPSKYYITVSSWQLNSSRQKITSNSTVSGAEKPPYGNPAPGLLTGERGSSPSRCPRAPRVIGKDSTWEHRHPSSRPPFSAERATLPLIPYSVRRAVG